MLKIFYFFSFHPNVWLKKEKPGIFKDHLDTGNSGQKNSVPAFFEGMKIKNVVMRTIPDDISGELWVG
jgi:hypothetical protein